MSEISGNTISWKDDVGEITKKSLRQIDKSYTKTKWVDSLILPRKKLVIAVDFDDTIVEHKFPLIGKLLPGAKSTLNKWAEQGHQIIIWTCRNQSEPDHPEWTEAPISAVKRFLDENGVKYRTINSDIPNLSFYLQSRKVYADVYIDDKNLGGFPGWDVAEFLVEKLSNPNFKGNERYN